MNQILVLALVLLIGSIEGASVNKVRRATRAIELDPRYSLNLEMDYEATTLTVHVKVQTTGFVGFGISPDGVMWGADIFVGGVAKGSPYFNDYYGRPGELFEDEVKNWELLEAKENGTHTELRFQRMFDTGDSISDVPIKDEATNIIWSIGQTDRILYHGPNRGNYPINFFDL